MDNGQETTYLEHPPIIQENQMDWQEAVGKVSRVIDDICKEYDAKEGSVFLIEPKELHNIKNSSSQSIKIIFIKGKYLPDDKYE